MVLCGACKFFKQGELKEICSNENSVYYGLKVSKNGRCWKGESK